MSFIIIRLFWFHSISAECLSKVTFCELLYAGKKYMGCYNSGVQVQPKKSLTGQPSWQRRKHIHYNSIKMRFILTAVVSVIIFFISWCTESWWLIMRKSMQKRSERVTSKRTNRHLKSRRSKEFESWRVKDVCVDVLYKYIGVKAIL